MLCQPSAMSVWGREEAGGRGVEKVNKRSKDVKKRGKVEEERAKGEGRVRVPFWGRAAAAFTCATAATLPLPFFFSFRRAPTHPPTEASLKVSRL